MKTNNLDNYSDDRVVDILSPRFAPTTNTEFKVTAPTPRRRLIWQFARVELSPQSLLSLSSSESAALRPAPPRRCSRKRCSNSSKPIAT